MKKNRKFSAGWQKFTPNKGDFKADAHWSCTSGLHGYYRANNAKYGNSSTYAGCCASEACIAKMKVFAPTSEEAKEGEIATLKSRVTELEGMLKDREAQIKYHVEQKTTWMKNYDNAQNAIHSLETRMRETDFKNMSLQQEKERYRIIAQALAKFGGITQ